MTFGSSPEHRVLSTVLQWLVIVISDFHHQLVHFFLYQQLVLTVACSGETILYIQQSILSFYQSTKHESPPSHSPKHGKMPIRVAALAFNLCILYYRSPCTL